jgi:hypothetical protein
MVALADGVGSKENELTVQGGCDDSLPPAAPPLELVLRTCKQLPDSTPFPLTRPTFKLFWIKLAGELWN